MPDRSTSPRIWIMGASDGIGAELARAYARRGAKLVLSARSEEPLHKLADEIGGAEVVTADVRIGADGTGSLRLPALREDIPELGPQQQQLFV